MGKGKKAPNGSGSIWKRAGDGRYGASVPYTYYDPETERTKRDQATTTKATWEAAHKWKVKTESELFGGAVMNPAKLDPPLAEYLSDWLRDAVEPSVAPKTLEKREYHVRVHLSPALGHTKIRDLQPRQIHTLYVRLAREGLAYSTRKDIYSTLKTSLKQAMKWGLIPQNPVELVDSPRLSSGEADHEDEEIRALTDEQARELFAAANPRWRNHYIAAVRTGLRPGEMLGLKWGDLDLEEDPGSLRVRRTLGMKKGGGTYFKPPKSKASRRTLALHWEAVDALASQKAMLTSEGLPAGRDDLVFPSTTGSPMSRHNLRRRYLQPDLERAGLPRLTLHELRHTFASIMLHEWRVYPETVREMLGHESITMTMDLYGHLMKSAQADAIRELRRLHKRPDETPESGAIQQA